MKINCEKEKIIEKLKIDFLKTCSCKDNHINCLNGKEWVKNQVAIWELYYEKRDVRNKDIHPASYPISLPRRCIELFTHPGELVVDPFMGIGSTLIAAQDTNRNAVGFDLNQKYVNYSKKRLNDNSSLNLYNTKQISICDDSINILNYLKRETVSLYVTSPPYADLLNHERLHKTSRTDLRKNHHYKKVLQYSNNPRDLGTMQTKEYIKSLAEIYRKIKPLLKPKAHCIINVNDLWQSNKRYPIHCDIIHALEKVGYELRNIIIWDKRNLVNRIGIYGYPSNYITFTITFEYILDFWRKP
ncbi:DNA methyltransferase [Candidatus Latescibacterota bacterium]